MFNEVRVVFCTFPDPETAHRIALEAVEQQYAACANLVPAVKSIYRWLGRVQQADETLVVYKTSAARYPDLEAFLLRSHPYEVPEIIALSLSAGSAAYVHWVIDNSGPEVSS
ncbi:MAG: divalent-cation tolerance protein CutA [Chthoniobacterales bacterium]|jgi:periplasmic divalent cation tolerance protein